MLLIETNITYAKNSFELVKKLQDFKIPPDYVIISLDLVTFYKYSINSKTIKTDTGLNSENTIKKRLFKVKR